MKNTIAGTMNELRTEHRNMVMLLDLLDAETLRQYSESLRKHMYWEEKDLFELADTMEDDDDWAALLKSHDEDRDTLFGSKTERRFQRLFNGIQRRIYWDSQQYFV